MAGEQEIRGTKNLGLIRAIYAGINAPLNTQIIWYDDNIGEKLHKVYDVNLSTWVPLGTLVLPTIEGNIKIRLRTATLASIGVASFDLVTPALVATYLQGLSLEIAADELLTLKMTNNVPNGNLCQVWQNMRGKGNTSLLTSSDVVLISDNAKSTNDMNFVHVQSVSSTSWAVNHGLGKYPSVTLLDDLGNEFSGEVQHSDTDNVLITVSPATTGKAIFN